MAGSLATGHRRRHIAEKHANGLPANMNRGETGLLLITPKKPASA